MECFQVIESGEGIERAILRGLSVQGGGSGWLCSDRHPALLVVSPKAVMENRTLPRACRTVLIPGSGGRGAGGAACGQRGELRPLPQRQP